MQHKLHLQIMMNSGLTKRDNRIVTLFLFTQSSDILLDCHLIRVISNSSNNSSHNAATEIQHITLLTTKVLSLLPWVAAYCHSFEIPTEKLITFNLLM